MKAFKTLAVFVLTAAFLLDCSRMESGGIVLCGDIIGNPGEVVILSYLPGQSIGYHYPEVKDGKFEFSLDNVEGFSDLIVSVGGVEFGARINASDTLRMSFVVNKYSEDVEVSYDGANEKEGRMWADFYETYEHWGNYGLTPDRDESLPYEESLAEFEMNDALFREKYEDDFDDYYMRRSELAHDLLKTIFLEMISYRDGTDPFDYPEYVAMVKKVDPNDPDQVTFPMITRWMSYTMKEFDGSLIDKYISFMKKYGRKLKKPEINKLLADNMISHTMMDIDIENPDIYEPFFAELEKFVLDGNKLVESCRGQIEAAINAQPGKPVPDTFLRTPDGQDVALSSLFGKVLYVDVWATWCGPCVKEGPYFRALAEKYRDDPRICFISLSTDDSDEPWLEFLENEKPFWPQYRLDGVNNDDFCNKVGIQTIPRFLLIDAEGNFINADCARPSSEEIETLLDVAIKF